MYVDSSRTYVGIVEENIDPEKLGRCRIRVIDIFDDIPIEDIPWASPWKDLNGNGSNIPEKGKVLTVVFESGNIYKPEYVYAEHYNINLESKLKSLDGDNYISMKSLIFDHKTQIYVNDDEGLKIDYKFNNINLLDDDININLKDNFGKINIGDSSSDQQAILGTNFLDWFDEFVSNLLGEKGGPYLGNLQAPVVANPVFIKVLQKYKAFKDSKFLSRNVYLNDNGAINSIRTDTSSDVNLRVNISQQGDSWTSSKGNNLSKIGNSNFTPKYGNGSESPGATSPDGSPIGLSSNDSYDNNNSNVSEIIGEINPDANKIISAIIKKGYELKSKPYSLNIIGIRYQYESQNYSNQFKDRIWAIWKNDSNQWESKSWAVSTIPGLYMSSRDNIKMKNWCKNNRPKGLGILVPAQYKNIYKFYESEVPENQTKMKARPTFRSVGNQLAYRDKDWSSDKISFSNKNNPESGNHGMFIHRGYPGGFNVNNWSEGCQVFSRDSDFKDLCKLARIHIKKHGNIFNYTLIMSNDL